MHSTLEVKNVTDSIFLQIFFSGKEILIEKYIIDDIIYTWEDAYLMGYSTKHKYDLYIKDLLHNKRLLALLK